ncbi:MAG: VOC family protein [Chloroflexi bacterium]|nr:VOC family protein [Chloroflexota bacterium]
MVQAPAYAPGTPIWVDLASHDLEQSSAFYSGLFGWDASAVPAPEAGGYTFFKLDGKTVAGLGRAQSPQQPAAWSTYLLSTDADATAASVSAAGGSTVAPPFDVMGQGRMAVFTDPTGAFFSVWQPISMNGAELFNAPGALAWNELATRDIGTARTFYAKVFDWSFKESPMGDTGAYTEFQIDGRPVAGGMGMGAHYPAEVPAHWLPYFGVVDVDAAIEKVQALGGRVLSPVVTLPFGRFAMVTDPAGAGFAVFEMGNG